METRSTAEKEHIIILLDVDDTLVNFEKCDQYTNTITYTGSRQVWFNNLKVFKEKAATQNRIVHYGIATSKLEYLTPYFKTNHMPGDYITTHILGGSFLGGVGVFKTPKENSLQELLDPELIYFVKEHLVQIELARTAEVEPLLAKRDAMQKNNIILFKALTDITKEIEAVELKYQIQYDQVKTVHALELARLRVQEATQTIIPKNHAVLIDNVESICLQTAMLDYHSLCITDAFSKSHPTTQVNVINNIFQNLLVTHFLVNSKAEIKTLATMQKWLKAINKLIPRHIAILLDIDDTIANYKACQTSFVYTATRDAWFNHLLQFKNNALQSGVIVHYGIATSKPKYLRPELATKDCRGDSISAYILGQNFNSDTYKNEAEARLNSLRELINPDLVYFVGEETLAIQAKIAEQQTLLQAAINVLDEDAYGLHMDRYRDTVNRLHKDIYELKGRLALLSVQKYLQEKHLTTIPKSDIVIIDNQPEICEYSAQLGFSAICVTNDFVKINPAKQSTVLHNIFQSILPSVFLEKKTLQAEDSIELAVANMRTWQDVIKNLITNTTSALITQTIFAVDTTNTNITSEIETKQMGLR
jgi:hypothetical protein